ncbi:putative ABC transporter ATP-binding protein [Fundidesulfovibrio magnetotacticus]|uniref:Putative ABC transporter ATP-binding protein n=1 Tax=Fundidesulfovibrio magnetotacticus TaxID=2730080 RepID=A0A6V8LVC6_9BACT|nr:ABC transporter ATP-binding protein [Fundidesulfovibrio magnetotacticus]GFK94900.1 putative ABC transporter ATP-binding protein [Fundidesulfovibrio magnetotacticus]
MAVFLKLLGYLRPYSLLFAFCLGLVGVQSALELLKPWPLKLCVDQIIARQPLEFWGWTVPADVLSTGTELAVVAIALVAVHFLSGFVQLANNYLTIRMGQDMVQDFRCELFDHLQRQSLLFHQTRPTGDLLYRLMGDTYSVQTLLMNGVFTTLTSIVLLMGMFFVLLGIDWELTLYAMAVVPLLILAIASVTKKIGNLTYETHMKESKVYSTVENIFNSISLVQAFAREDEERRRFVAESQHSFDRKLTLYSLQTAYGWLVGAITAAGTAYVLYVGARHVLEGDLSTGDLLIFLGYLASLYTPLNNIANTMGAIRGSLAQARRVLDVLAEDKAVPEAPDAKPLEITKGAVEFSGVTFGYDPERPVLSGVSFKARGGATVAVVGQTGAGKTSLISLLLRFYDPQKGAITIDGQDLRNVTLKSVRQQVAIVLQDTHLFPMSVHDNIAYGKRTATREEVVAAATLANAHEFIEAMPQGYDSLLDERGSNLSGGQRQRLSIARALLKDAPLLILDEPTSALDAGTEAQIMEGLDRLMENRTTFVIAHRMSMMRRADLILVIKDKTVSEMGTFQELLDKGGEFARLHALQFAPLKERRPRDAQGQEIVAEAP